MTTSDYLTQLQQDKSDLVDNLTEKGITGLTGDETFTELVPEVLNISSGSLEKDMETVDLVNGNYREISQEEVTETQELLDKLGGLI